MRKTDVSVIAAHPDDEVLGCGGTISRLAREGYRFHVLILAEGITSRTAIHEEKIQKELLKLRSAASKAAAVLGAENVDFAGFPDNRMDSIDTLDVVKTVERHIERYRPTIVFTHHASDLNVDHRITAGAVCTACRPLPGSPVKDIYAFEVLSSTEWQQQGAAGAFHPVVFTDISATLNDKIKALGCYASEMRKFPHPRSIEAVRALAVLRGSQAGLKAAEAFSLIRSVR